MATSKSSTRKKPIYSNIKEPVKPKWMRVLKVLTMIMMGVFLLLVIAGIMLKYHRIISNHK